MCENDTLVGRLLDDDEVARMVGPTTQGNETVPNCVASPELTEGPYFVDENLLRSDVRPDPSTGESVDGIPLELEVQVLRVSEDGCRPLVNAQVDIWQCNALGIYSDVGDPGISTIGQQFLRGYQITGDDGRVAFTTVYPGWYQGRTVHIHFKVRSRENAGASYDFTSQLFFDDELSNQVFEQEPYAGKGERDTRNTSDSIFQQCGERLLLNMDDTAVSYSATIDIGLVV